VITRFNNLDVGETKDDNPSQLRQSQSSSSSSSSLSSRLCVEDDQSFFVLRARAEAAIAHRVASFNGKLVPDELCKLSSVGVLAAKAAVQAGAAVGSVWGGPAGIAALQALIASGMPATTETAPSVPTMANTGNAEASVSVGNGNAAAMQFSSACCGRVCRYLCVGVSVQECDGVSM
jgi:hypothetical protein